MRTLEYAGNAETEGFRVTDNQGRLPIINGVVEEISPKIPQINPVLIEKGREGDITQTIDLAVDVAAPVEQGQVLGTVTFRLGEEEIGVYNLTSPDSVEALTFGIIFKRIISAIAS